jgi:tetratricopeptide (TPR) repeat protein
MKRFTAILTAFVLLSLAGGLVAAEKDVVSKIRQDIQGRSIFNPRPETAEKDRPVITPRGPISPTSGAPLEVFFLRANKKRPNDVKVAAFYSPSERKYWTFVWGGPKDIRVMAGPFTLRKVTLEMVRKAIKRLITPEGNYGFYDGQFKEIEAMGKASIPWLLELFRDESNEMPVRVLALEALGDMKDNSVIPKLRELIYNESYSQFQRPIAFTLAKLGDQTFSDMIIDRYKNYIRNSEGQPRAQASGYSGLAHAYSRLKKHEKAIECYKKVIELDPESAPGSYYNMACSLAKLKRVEDAVSTLQKAVDAGYDDWQWMSMDGDLAPLRKDERFKRLIETLKRKSKGE